MVGPDVVLVRARAAGVNPVDYKVPKGGLANRYPCDFPLVPGWDVAGVVEATGPAVPELSVGPSIALRNDPLGGRGGDQGIRCAKDTMIPSGPRTDAMRHMPSYSPTPPTR